MSDLVDALAITPGQAPGGLVSHLVSRCHVMLACDHVASGDEAVELGTVHSNVAAAHLSSCPCGSVTLVIHDGDSGQLVFAEVIERA